MFTKLKTKLNLVLIVAMLVTLFPASITNVHAVKASTAAKISSIGNISKSLEQNAAFTMPTTVNAVMSDKKQKAVAVIWDKKLTTAKVGTFKANGTVSGYSKKVLYTLIVKEPAKISSIGNISQTVKYRENFTMPTAVTAIMSDKTKKTVAVKWDKELTTAGAGIFTANGTVAGYGKKVIYTLTVQAPKMGTVKIPEVTDASLKKPGNIRFSVSKLNTWENDKQIIKDGTQVSVEWSSNAADADTHEITIYDEYKQKLQTTTYFLGGQDKRTEYYYNIDLADNVTISAITITPINSVDGTISSGEGSNDKIGETAVFECALSITLKKGKDMTMSTTVPDYDQNRRHITLSDKITPNTSYSVESEYARSQDYGMSYGTSSFGGATDKDGTVSGHMDLKEYNERYANPLADVKLTIFSDVVIKSTTQAAVTVTVHNIIVEGVKKINLKSYDGVYKYKNDKIVLLKDKYQFKVLYIVGDDDRPPFLNVKFEAPNKFTYTSENDKGPCVKMELVIDGNTIHLTRILLQDNNYTIKEDFVKTDENPKKILEKNKD